MKEKIVPKKKTLGIFAVGVITATAVAAHVMRKKAEKTTYKADLIDPIPTRNMGFYEKYIKRAADVACSAGAIVVFSPLYIGLAAMVKHKLGSPILFTQDRPGLVGKDGKETIFKMYKFRTMTDERDENGELLPDEKRLTKFGAWLRNSSLDGNVIIGQTTESLVNKGFREVSPIHFSKGRDLFSKSYNDFHAGGEGVLVA